MINKLPYIPSFGLDLNRISVYDIDCFSTQEVLSIIIKRLNELLNEFNKIDMDGIIEWLKKQLPEMVREEVIKQLEALIASGALKEEIYKRITEYIQEGLMDAYVIEIINRVLGELDITEEVLNQLKLYFNTEEFKTIIKNIVLEMDLGGSGSTEYPTESYETESEIVDKKYPPLNVKRYGAKGDGTTNDLNAFTIGLKTAIKANGNLDIPSDTYLINGKIVLEVDEDKVISFGMTGSNAILITEQATSNDKYFIEVKSIGNNLNNSVFTIFNIHNLRFINKNKKTSGYTLLCSYGINIDIENITLDGYGGLLLTNNETNFNNYIRTTTRLEDVIAYNITSALITINHELNSVFNNVKLYSSLKETVLVSKSILRATKCNNLTINNINVIGKEKKTAFMQYNNEGIYIKNCHSVIINNICEYISQFRRFLIIDNSVNVSVKNITQLIQTSTAVKIVNNVGYNECRNIFIEGIYLRGEGSNIYDIEVDDSEIGNKDIQNIVFKNLCLIHTSYDENLNETSSTIRHPYTARINSHYIMNKDKFYARVEAGNKANDTDINTKSIDGNDIYEAVGYFRLVDNNGYMKIELPNTFENITSIISSVRPCIFSPAEGAFNNMPYEAVFEYNSASFYFRDLDTNTFVTRETFDETKANFIVCVESYL